MLVREYREGEMYLLRLHLPKDMKKSDTVVCLVNSLTGIDAPVL